MLDVGGTHRADAAAIGRVREWVDVALPNHDAAVVMVTELACHEPGCPPVETVIALLGGSGSRTWKIPRSAADLAAADVAAALARPPLRFAISAPGGGRVAVFTEHHPDDFSLRFTALERRLAPLAEHAYKPDHEHDEEVTSVGMEVAGDVDGEKLNAWLRDLLATKGVDLYRMKGVLAIRDEPRRYVFQGVHMLLDHRPDRPWGDTPRAIG